MKNLIGNSPNQIFTLRVHVHVLLTYTLQYKYPLIDWMNCTQILQLLSCRLYWHFCLSYLLTKQAKFISFLFLIVRYASSGGWWWWDTRCILQDNSVPIWCVMCVLYLIGWFFFLSFVSIVSWLWFGNDLVVWQKRAWVMDWDDDVVINGFFNNKKKVGVDWIMKWTTICLNALDIHIPTVMWETLIECKLVRIGWTWKTIEIETLLRNLRI